MKVFSHPSFAIRLTAFILSGLKNQLIEKNCTAWRDGVLARISAKPAKIPYRFKWKYCRYHLSQPYSTLS